MDGLIKLPYNVGDRVFIAEDYNQYWDVDYYNPIHTIYGTKIVIKAWTVEGFIIDDKGVHLAEDGHDGWNKLTTYHDLTLDKDGECKIFGNLAEAKAFVDGVKAK
jgi:hypothetical protein